jgi:crossover junction endodeoxyribonuclease RuvC
MFLIGVDPGFTGGIGILDSKGRFVAVHDMPLIKTETGKVKIVNLKRVRETKQEVDGVGFRNIVTAYKKSRGVIEAVHAMPEQGVVSVFNFGLSYGIALGVMQCLDLNPVKISPNKWKKDMKLNSDKSVSIEKARELFPEASEFLKLKKHDGRAESLLLAYYLYRYMKVS